jgi:hypothetical protein
MLYLVLSLLTIGWYPISDPTRVCACAVNTDPTFFMWSLGWWPHALLHGLNPFVSHFVWAPTGANLARSATIPTAALFMAPATLLFGPLASYNLLLVASPVLAGFTAYLLCRRIVGRELAALAGGYLFGFGPYQFAQLVAHPNASLVFLVPVMVHLALRRVEREISARLYVAGLAAVFVLQMGLSSEVLFTAGVLGLISLLTARVIAPPPQRERIRGLIAESAGAGLLALALSAPFVYLALIKGGSPQEWPLAEAYGLDLLNPFFPTQVTWLGSHAFQALSHTFEGANPAEADGYLSLPIIAAFVLWFANTRRRFLARMVLVVIAVSFLAALGAYLHVAGVQTVELPFNWVKNLPVARLITPSRIAVFGVLALAIGVAAWLAEGRGRGVRSAARWLVFGLGALMIFPNVAGGLFSGSPANPTFFRSSTYRHFLRADESVLVMPFGWNGNSMLWQAETGFYFRMPEGYLGHLAPPQFDGHPIIGELYSNNQVNPDRLASFVARYHVRDIVVDASAVGTLVPFTAQLAGFGLHPISVGGVLLYRVPAWGL